MFNIKSKNNKERACPAKSRQTGRSRGVAVLFAVLVSVLMVSIAATMTSIAIRQTILSNTGRDSQYAIFAANTALECALYWDLKDDIGAPGDKVFPNAGLGETRPSDIASGNIMCNKGNIVTGSGFSGKAWNEDDPDETTFYMEITPVGGSGTYCASATVKKFFDTSTDVATTVIEAKGHNTCNLSSPRAIERGLELSYTS